MTPTVSALRKLALADKTTIGNTIKAARVARGLTLQNVAESLGLRSRQQIYEWESGRVCPGPKHLAKLADVLGLDVLELLPSPRAASAALTATDNPPSRSWA